MSAFRTIACAGLCLLFCGGFCGCESLTQGTRRLGVAAPAKKKDEPTINSERNRYQTDRSPRAQRWLLAHGVQQQMTVAEINSVFGEDGERVYDDAWLKKGSSYRSDDVVYRWGPDRQGRNVYLVFRNKRLIHFDPKEFE